MQQAPAASVSNATIEPKPDPKRAPTPAPADQARQGTAPQHGVQGVTPSTTFTSPPDGLVITIDGPAGTGKSSVARRLAERLGLDFLDTGAMYRAAAAIAIDYRIDHTDAQALVKKVVSADLHFDWSRTPPAIMAWYEPIDHRIRHADVTSIVSAVATIADLRHHMVRKQRLIAHQHPRLVTEGRDQGSMVFPQAPAKFFLDASPDVRARRRAEQLEAAGQTVDLAALTQAITLRDQTDSTRTDGPLICPEDATVIDTSDITLDEVVNLLEAAVRKSLGARLA